MSLPYLSIMFIDSLSGVLSSAESSVDTKLLAAFSALEREPHRYGLAEDPVGEAVLCLVSLAIYLGVRRPVQLHFYLCDLAMQAVLDGVVDKLLT